MRAGFMRGIPSLLADFGHDPVRVLRDIGMDPARLSSPHGTLSFARAAELLAHCARITGCPHFGVLAGERFDPTVFGETARLMRESSTVGAALQTFVLRHHLVDAGAVAMLMPVSRGRAGLAYSVYVPLPEGLDLVTDIALACGFQLLRAMCGSAWQPLKVSLPHREPADATPYRRFFGQNVAFNANVASIAFSAPGSAPPSRTIPSAMRGSRAPRTRRSRCRTFRCAISCCARCVRCFSPAWRRSPTPPGCSRCTRGR